MPGGTVHDDIPAPKKFEIEGRFHTLAGSVQDFGAQAIRDEYK